MKGNDKIAFTAEAIALMRDYLGHDKFSNYFVGSQILKNFKMLRFFIPNSYIDNMFRKRIKLSNEIDNLIKSYKPEQIVELACGYSTRGLLMTQKNHNLSYIETDFSLVIKRKKKILRDIENKEKIKLSKNHHLVEIDAINSDLYKNLRTLLDNKKRTLVIAETLNSYLTPEEFDFSIKNIINLLRRMKQGAYLSHETKKMLSGFIGRMLLFYRNRIAKTKGYSHFSDEADIKKSIIKKGFKSVQVRNSRITNNLLYLARIN